MADTYRALSKPGGWRPKARVSFGAFAGTACDWQRPGQPACRYVTMLREPSSRDNTETPPDTAATFPQHVTT